MNIEITGETEKLIQAALAAGEGFGNANNYIRALVEEDQLTRTSLSNSLRDQAGALESLAIEGLESGESVAVDGDFWQQRQRHVNKSGSTE